MKPKYKVGDRVKYINGTIGKVEMNNHTTYQGSPYLIECRNGGRFFSTETELQSIPEPSNFERGEKVWHKTLMSVWEFHRYDDQMNINLCVVNKLNSYLTTPESDIEPYTGQDKVKEETQKERNSRLAAELIDEVTRLHPELKQVRSGKFLYNPNRKNVFSIDLVKEFKFNSPPYIWIETWEGSDFSIEDTDGKIKERIIKWTEE